MDSGGSFVTTVAIKLDDELENLSVRNGTIRNNIISGSPSPLKFAASSVVTGNIITDNLGKINGNCPSVVVGNVDTYNNTATLDDLSSGGCGGGDNATADTP